jgi:membrane complex biogenesis BtpA family protein
MPEPFRLPDPKCMIIGMIHVGALPGTPRYGGDVGALLAQAEDEARIYRDQGIDALLVENMHDVPYLKRKVGPEITAAMTLLGHRVKTVSGLPVGLQILAGANPEAMAAAHLAGLDFIRAEGFVFGHLADEGYMDACAGELLRYRHGIGADGIQVFTDIKKKHSSHALTQDLDIVETAKAAAFFEADGVIITGSATGAETDLDEVRAVRQAVTIPVLVGSGVTLANVDRYLGQAHTLIVGSHFKEDGRWQKPVDPVRVGAFMARVRQLRQAL